MKTPLSRYILYGFLLVSGLVAVTHLRLSVVGGSMQVEVEAGSEQRDLAAAAEVRVRDVLAGSGRHSAEKEVGEMEVAVPGAVETAVNVRGEEADDLYPNLSGAVQDGPGSLLEPSAVRGQRFPDVEGAVLAQGLPETLRGIFRGIFEEFPEVDLTDVHAFHEMITDKRAGFGFDLTDETADSYRAWMAEANAVHRAMVRLRARELGLSPGGVDEDGRGYALIGFDGGRPRYTYTANVEAAISTGANLVRWNYDFDPVVNGSVAGGDLYVNINDHGEIYEHTEFQLPDGVGSRIMVAETPWYDNANRNHMTHVAGTVAAWGYNSTLLGMAPRSWVRALIQQNTSHVSDFGMRYPGEMHNEINPRTGEMQMKSVMGNTSLGTAEPNTRYTAASRSFDTVLRDFPYYVHVYAASNSGSNFETLGGDNPVGKNVMSIGAVQDVSRDAAGNYVSGGGIAGFSSRGPAYDGRIKPDFTANGVGVRSTTGTTGSSSLQGTSMAAPNATGSILLLIDYVHQRFSGHFFRSSTYKALLMTTADDRGNPGPDYTYGWGILNVYAAGNLIGHHAENSYDRVVREERLHPGQSWSYTYTSDGSEAIRVSLAWLDVPGASQTTSSTDRSARLVNDLDMRIVGPDNQVYTPYVMPYTTGKGDVPPFDDSLRNAHAVTGDNVTDPAEQIWISAPVAGNYTVQITHKGTLNNNQPQPFSLAIRGLTSATAEPAVITAVTPNEGNDSDNFAMAVLGSGFVLGSEVRLRRDGSPVVAGYRIVPVGDRIDFRVDTAGIDAGYYDVVVVAPDGTASVLENGFLMPAAGGTSGVVTLYSNSFETADGLTLTGDWAVGVPNQRLVGGPDAAFSGTQVLGTYLDGNYENNLNITATLPPISTINRTGVKLEFRRWLGVDRTTGGGPAREDYARIHYSLDGVSNWQQIWSATNLKDSGWVQQSFQLPVAAENQNQVFLRFQLQTDHADVSYGWNLDDLRVRGEAAGGLLLPPVFTSDPVPTATVGEEYSYIITTSDADTPAAELTLVAGALPPGLSFVDQGEGTGVLSGTPTLSGSYEITLSVTDGDYTTWQVFDLLIFPEGGNTPPVMLTESIPAANQAQAYHATLAAEDADGHALRFSVTSLPGWLQFTDNGDGTATLSGTPTALATYSFTVTVTDGFESDERAYTLKVNPQPQVGFTVSSVNVWEDAGTVTVQVSRTLNDAGAVQVDYATQDGEAVAGSDYAATSGTLTWADGAVDSQPITVTIFDDELTQGDRAFTLRLSNVSDIATMGTSVLTVTILDNNNNTPPVVDIAHPLHTRILIPPGMGVLVSGSVHDDGLPAWGNFTSGWTVDAQPEGAEVGFTHPEDLNTGITFSHEGRYTLMFTADDGEFSTTQQLTVDVTSATPEGFPQENLALWLPLDESSGTVAGDLSGHDRHADLIGDFRWRPEEGKVGGALELTNSGQRGTVANSAGLNNTAQMSWAFWLHPAGTVSSDQGLLGKRVSTSGKDWGFWMKANSSNRITVDIGGTRVEMSSGIPALEWTHATFVYDGTRPQAERMAIYLNGAFAQYLAISETTIPSQNVNIALGSFQVDDTRNFRGMLDEVVIYHGRALTAEEVGLVMTGGCGNLGPWVDIEPVTGAQAQQAVQLSATVTDDGLPKDPGVVSLLWTQVSGPEPVEFSSATAVDATVTFPVAGAYTLRLVANDGEIATYAEVVVSVAEPGPFAPLIFTQPVSHSVLEGAVVTFAVEASGNPEPVYQWYHDGQALKNATAATHTITDVSPADTGAYFVRVTNDLGSEDSLTASLTIIYPPAAPTGLTATVVSHNTIALAWAESSGEIDGFQVEGALSVEGPWEVLAHVTETHYSNGGLAPQTTHYSRVRAFNAAGNSDWSATVSATTERLPEEILRYEFTHAAEGVAPTFAHANLISGPVLAGAGLNRFRTDEVGAENTLSVVNDSTRTDVDEAFAHEEVFTITLAPEAGMTLNLETLDFKVARGGAAGVRKFAVRSSVAPDINLLGPKEVQAERGSWDLESVDLSGPEFQGVSSAITFYFVIATDDTGRSIEFDDISFTGLLREVDPVSATVTLDHLTHSYTGEAKTATVQTSPEGLTVVITYNGSTEAPAAAGSYEVVATIVDETYEGSATGTLSISAAPVTVSAHELSKVEAEADPPLTWEITDGQLYGADAISGELSREPGEVSGFYAIQQHTLSAGDNYVIAFQEATFRILTVYGFVDSNGDGIADDWWDAQGHHFDAGATADTEVVQGGVTMSIREIFIAGLDPGDPDDRLAFDGFLADGMPAFTQRDGREYRVRWSDDLTLEAVDWQIWKDFGDALPGGVPGNARVFYRLDVRLRRER